MIMVSVYAEHVKISCQFIWKTSKTSEITIIIIIIIILIYKNLFIIVMIIIDILSKVQTDVLI